MVARINVFFPLSSVHVTAKSSGNTEFTSFQSVVSSHAFFHLRLLLLLFECECAGKNHTLKKTNVNCNLCLIFKMHNSLPYVSFDAK